ncbi:PD-(D/E)XK nuclease domain-containing protein [Treponema primitia]|uniref:ATP-binding protein n=1 Tax=Treponema primitia TaxID=88058 RepID=UPI00397F4C13
MSKRKIRFFNTTGPCNPDDHYMLPPAERLVGAQLDRYIADKLYWVLHAPRQTGKTTFLQSWMREINAGNSDSEPIACYVSVESCQGIADPERAMRNIYHSILNFAQLFDVPIPHAEEKDVESLVQTTLINWCELVAPKPLIVLFDEVDVLQGEPLISFLRQLRGGFAGRGAGKFPISIALVGMRDLKDYITASKGGIPPNPGSPFNIKSDSASLSNFQKDDIGRLFAQRTAETGQQISAEALDYVYDQSMGQPWIVNSLFMRATMRVLERDSTETVTIDHIQEARKQMIEARETHLDALGERLRDQRIRRVIQTIITGETNLAMSRTSPDIELAMDLGLVRWDTQTGFTISNPIYEEIMTRYLDAPYHDNLPPPSTWQWAKPDGTLDMDALLKAFQDFWQNNSEVWEQAADYPEAFPHLLLMAFLQRITNGSGRIEREYAAGRGRMDLAVEYHGAWNILEIKLLRQGKSFETLMAEGIKQTLGYRDSFAGANGGTPVKCYLIIFDRRPDKPAWGDRIKWLNNGDVTVVGC